MQSQNVHIFSPASEKIFFSCLTFLGLCCCLDLLGIWPRTIMAEALGYFIVNFVFLNFIHVGFTFLILGLLPEFRGLLKAKLKSKSSFLILGMVAANLIYFLGRNFVFSLGPWRWMIETLVLSFFAIHALAQTKGLSLLYNSNQRNSLDEKELKIHLNCERLERFLFNFLIFAFLSNLFLKLNFADQWENLQEPYFFLTLGLATALYANCFRYPQIQRTHKRFYLLVIFFYPLSEKFLTALLIVQALHGLEYTLLTVDMSKRSQAKMTKTKAIAIGGFLAGTYFAYLFVRGYFPITYEELSPPLNLLVPCLTFMMTYTHYVMDSQLFRLSDPQVRFHISGLIRENSQASAPARERKVS